MTTLVSTLKGKGVKEGMEKEITPNSFFWRAEKIESEGNYVHVGREMYKNEKGKFLHQEFQYILVYLLYCFLNL